LQLFHVLVGRRPKVAQGIVLSQLGVLGFSEPVIWEELIGRGAARIVDELDNGPDVVFGVVDARDDRGANDDVDLGKLGTKS
jgi:hypothetical protein